MNDGLPPLIPAELDVAACLVRARAAASAWASTPIRERLKVIGRLRRLIASSAVQLAATLSDRRSLAEALVVEVLPLADAAAFLEREAGALLAPRRPRGSRPLWLIGVRAEITREPAGVVLILCPSNYPLFLPGAQILQALAAGNAVCAKPAPGRSTPLAALTKLLARAGLPEHLFQVLDSALETGEIAARAGFDHIVLTGSAQTGRLVMASAAQTLTPTTMELSGSDAMFILPGADLDLAAASLAYGLRLNGGATCIAPRRVFISRVDARDLERRLLDAVRTIPPAQVSASVRTRLTILLAEAAQAGARVLRGVTEEVSPIIVADAAPTLRLLREDVFAPVVSIVPVDSIAEALQFAQLCPYALGATIFGPAAEARRLASFVRAGCVVINDVIVPTADPRLAFGGRGESGFGVTRGPEGLLEFTRIKTVSLRTGRFRPHLAPARERDGPMYANLVQVLHGTAATRYRAVLRMAKAAFVGPLR